MSRLIVETRDGLEQAIESAAGLDELEALCGGSCSCATCHVYVDRDFLDRLPKANAFEEELVRFSDHHRANSRLSCQIPFVHALDGLRVTIAPAD